MGNQYVNGQTDRQTDGHTFKLGPKKRKHCELQLNHGMEDS